jgi:hypothetical protein
MLRKEHRLKAFEENAMKRISGSKQFEELRSRN